MKIIRFVRWVFSLAIVLFLSTFCFVVGFAALQPVFEPNQFARADRIVVLGAGMSGDGTLHASSKQRVEKAVQIYKSDAASALFFTGGARRANGVSAGEQMVKYAIELGVPMQATSYEGNSHSTFQNALFSAPYLKNDHRIILVSEGFHLPRSWVSMKLFGDYDIALAHSASFRQANPKARLSPITMCIRETLAIWFNLGRYLVWYLAPFSGMDEATRNDLLH